MWNDGSIQNEVLEVPLNALTQFSRKGSAISVVVQHLGNNQAAIHSVCKGPAQ